MYTRSSGAYVAQYGNGTILNLCITLDMPTQMFQGGFDLKLFWRIIFLRQYHVHEWFYFESISSKHGTATMLYSCIIIWTVGDHRPFKDGLPRNHTYSQIDACLLDLNTDDGPSISFIVQLKLKYLHIITPLLTRSSPDTDTQMHNFQIWHAQSRL